MQACQGATAFDILFRKSQGAFRPRARFLKWPAYVFEHVSPLVRGFDYYTETLWEVTAGDLAHRTQSEAAGGMTILLNCWVDDLRRVWALGRDLERLLLALEAQNVTIRKPSKPLIYLIAQSDAAKAANLALLLELRQANFAAEMDYAGRAMKAQFKLADREGATLAVITGDDELANGTVTLKDYATGKQPRCRGMIC